MTADFVEGYKSRHLELQMNDYQREKLARALAGLKARNATTNNGKPVYTLSHALYYIIEKLSDVE